MAVSPMQILLVALIVLILFGASRLGDIGKGLGEGIRNFKKGISGDDDEPASGKEASGKDSKKEPKQLTEGSKASQRKQEREQEDDA